MATAQLIRSDSLTAGEHHVRFYGTEGSTVRRRWYHLRAPYWSVISTLLSSMYFFRPAGMRAEISKLIKADIAANNGGRVAAVRVNSLQALALYAEGVITFDHLTKRVEHDDHMVIPGVELMEGFALNVIVYHDVIMATLDRDGEVL